MLLGFSFLYFVFKIFIFRILYLRDDVVTDGNCLKDVMRNATKTLEDYYVAPPGICIDMNITIHTNVQFNIFIIMKIDYIIDKSIPDNLKHNDELRVVNIKIRH